MSWLILELSRHPDSQRKLQREIDEAVSKVGGIHKMEFKDYYKMDYVASCIYEALRFGFCILFVFVFV